ncbi:carbohydrate binding family 9 domain-containing protein [Larkinella soli]|uniref:carbohydrate binding family 9 domain-containing protein n=1 Tax=Larkinella soli TaxID=1770527 RepID=UPI000FFB99DE|nr:carbohydrate binding family 9 domain-containing protein [Larkinella soli]
MRIRLPVIALLLCHWTAKGQDATVFSPDSVKRTLAAGGISTLLRIDGRLNEPEWQTVRPAGSFVMVEPFQGNPVNHDTEVRVLYNRQYLYVGAFMRDSLGRKGLRVTDFRRDFNIRSHDLFGLAIDGFNDQRNAMVLMTNPYGTQRDLLSFDDVLYDNDWDGLWRVRTTRTDSGWVAEMAIPWQTLRYPRSADSTRNWGINFFRNRRLTNEISGWSRYPRSFSPLRMDYAGRITGLQPPPPSPNIRIQPYLLTSFGRRKGTDLGNGTDQSLKLGGEAKWAINPNTVLDLTFNTDFAQADADRQVNNVTRFSVFFPERRQFFLENASLFGAGLQPSDDLSGGSMRIQPFFSRRIGLDEAGNPLPIDAGARLVYRSLKRNFGGLLMRQRETDQSPATNFAVGRYSQNFGKQNRIGGLVTLRQEADLRVGADSLRPGRTSWVSAVDGFFRLNASHSLNTMLIQSASTDGRRGNGFAGYVQYYYTSNQWKLWWTQSVVTRHFNPTVGFVSRNDVIATTPGLFWYNRGRWIPFKKLIRAFEPGVSVEMYHQASTGRLIESVVSLNPIWFNFQGGGYFGFLINPTYQYLTEPFEPLGVTILPDQYRYTRYQFYLGTNQAGKVSASANAEMGRYYNGRLSTADLSLRYSPIPHISLIGRYVTNRFRKVGEERTSANVDLYSVEGRLALNPRLQLIGFYQHNTADTRDNYNIRLAWEYRPLSFLYLVFNQRAYTTLSRQQEQNVIAKLSYLKQF